MNNIILIATHWPTVQNTIDLIKACSPFWKVIVLVDEVSIHLPDLWVDCEVRVYPNEGYDFGKIYHFLKEYKEPIDMLCYTNDTISPIGDFQQLFDKSVEYEFYGATSAYSRHPDFADVNGYHIQSFFHIFRGRAIDLLKSHYEKNGIKRDKEGGVLTYEMGTSKIMQQAGMKMGAFIEIEDMMQKYWRKRYETMIYSRFLVEVEDPTGELNATFMYPIQYAEEWLPFVKNSMFSYHFRPLRFLYWITKKALEINKDKALAMLKTMFNYYNMSKQAKGFIVYMCTIIFNNK